MKPLEMTYENIKNQIKEGKIENSKFYIKIMTEEVFIMSLLNGYNFYLCLNCGWFKYVKYFELENKTSSEISKILQTRYDKNDLARIVKRK